MKRRPGPDRVGDILPGVLEGAGIREQLERQRVLEEWSGIVGAAIAAVTRPRSVTDRVLVVEVRSSAWLMELDMMKRQILGKVNAGREARVERIHFVLAEDDREEG